MKKNMPAVTFNPNAQEGRDWKMFSEYVKAWREEEGDIAKEYTIHEEKTGPEIEYTITIEGKEKN